MPRNSRPNAPGIPRLVSMVGHNQGVVFHSRDDCVTFLACLEESTYEVDCALHAFALMSNRVLLLVSPCSSASLSRFIQSISRQFTLTVNRRRGRCGTLWTGRYRAALVEPSGFLLTAYRFIDTFANRLKTPGVPNFERYCSFPHHGGSRRCRYIEEHEVYRRLSSTELERRQRYRELCESPLPASVISSIESTIYRQLVLGSDDFRDAMAKKYGIKVRLGNPGRPPKSPAGQPRSLHISPGSSGDLSTISRPETDYHGQ